MRQALQLDEALAAGRFWRVTIPATKLIRHPQDCLSTSTGLMNLLSTRLASSLLLVDASKDPPAADMASDNLRKFLTIE